ncbi:MAG: ribosomal L7Ae/L30e/S12e/Gadd45 family protein [Clostridiales bacterium]|nr:ribosomal L7Ae/L30e/S12e/Gadd45 family protein [Clostridiales bacterium]
MDNKRTASLLGLAQKAGKLKTGEGAILSAIRSGGAKLVVVAPDASDNTRKIYRDKCSFYGVPIREALPRETLSRAIGRSNRPAAAVTDEGLSSLILKSIETQ